MKNCRQNLHLKLYIPFAVVVKIFSILCFLFLFCFVFFYLVYFLLLAQNACGLIDPCVNGGQCIDFQFFTICDCTLSACDGVLCQSCKFGNLALLYIDIWSGLHACETKRNISWCIQGSKWAMQANEILYK